MSRTLAERILAAHLVSGDLVPGAEIAIRIDHTLTQDATGTLAYLQFEALGIPAARNELALSFVDHNMLQTGFENADDHRFLQTFAARYGVRFSRPGNGISHQVNLERFAVPGRTLLGADSHTPTAGGIGVLAIGAGGLDVAMAMAGQPFSLAMPRLVGVKLSGTLRPWVSAKDVILELLRRLTVRGGIGRIFEYFGDGVASLSVPERATITNMGAELGATTSLFPSDAQTHRYLAAQGRGESWLPLGAAPDATYDELIEIRLGELEPLVALPHSPDNVVPISEAAGTPIQQVAIGSCTNSSYRDLQVAAAILSGHTVHPDVSLVVTPGSRQALLMAEESGALATFVQAGARILESGCGPCIGMGQAPASGSASLRSFNRNFAGRSGTADARVYLASPELCAVAAIAGHIADPRQLGLPYPSVAAVPERYLIDDRMVIEPRSHPDRVTVVRGPNIAPLPRFGPLAESIRGPLLLVLGDDVSTDTILPAGAKILPLRSNIPALSTFAFSAIDPTFSARAQQHRTSFVLGGSNFGQGSSREHAAIVLRSLGIAAVIAKSFARIHATNLVNFGVLPLLLEDPADHERLRQGDELTLEGVADGLRRGERAFRIAVPERGASVKVRHALNDRQIEIVLAGGLLNVDPSTAARSA